MDIITQNAMFRQGAVKYSYKNTVKEAAIRYKVAERTIYRWRDRYDRTLKSLKDKSRRPKHCNNEQTPEEIALIKKLYPYYPDKMTLWDRLREKGYKRCYQTLCKTIRKLGLETSGGKRKPRKPKPYKRAEYPGQKVQIDVKFVPRSCVADGNKYYQYTAVDECTRLCFREMYDEHSTYSSLDFLKKLIEFFPFPIREVQTDNGTEWTNALLVKSSTHKTLFEQHLEDCGIIYHRIRVATPRHNGKVERQHRIDEVRFYSRLRMYGLEDGRKQIKTYNKKSNNIAKSCLKYRSPNAVLQDYLGAM